MIWFFIVTIVIALVTGVWIAVSGVIEKYTEYWERIGEDMRLLKDTPPQLWGTLGFTVPPQTVSVKSNVTGEPGESPYFAEKTFEFNLSPNEMQVFADGILTGSHSLAEADWKETVLGQAKVRKLKQQMFLAGLIQQRNPRNSLDGFILSEKGLAYLNQFASDWVNNNTDLQVVSNPVTTPLLER